MEKSATRLLTETEIKASNLFDESWYLESNPDVREAGWGALDHYISHGSEEGRAASPFFLTQYYQEQLSDEEKRENAIIHYTRVGEARGLKPNPLFDPNYYKSLVAIEPSPPETLLLDHIQTGGGHAPHPDIAPEAYASAMTRAQAGGHPLAILLREGGYCDGPGPIGFGAPTPDRRGLFAPRAARHRFEKLTAVQSDEDFLVLAVYAPRGSLSQAQQSIIRTYRAEGFHVILAISSGDFEQPLCGADREADTILVRENIGFDVAAWRDVCAQLRGRLSAGRSVTFTNDSVIPIRESLAAFRDRAETAGDIVFASRNHQLQPHGQSFFFTAYGKRAAQAALDTIEAAPSFEHKQDLIERFEVGLDYFFRLRGANVGYVYDPGPLNDDEGRARNPSIAHWKELIEDGFPFVKAVLFGDEADAAALQAHFNEATVRQVRTHLEARLSHSAKAPTSETYWPNAFGTTAPFNSDGARNAVNPPRSLDVPVAPQPGESPDQPPKVLCVLHCYYLDEAEIILDLLAKVGGDFRYLLTCPHDDQLNTLDDALAVRGLNGEVVRCRNRGRNVAPFLIETPQRLGDADLVLHLHTKKSPHDSRYRDWAAHLRENLVGDRRHVEAVFSLFEAQTLGLAYSDHFEAVAGLRNWGFDFPAAQRLLERAGIRIDADTPLEFPTSTMFWARPAALRKLWDLGLDYDDFEPEEGQIDGTLAHSIERVLCYVAEDAGFGFCSLVNERDGAAERAVRTDDFDAVRRVRPLRLLGNQKRLLGLDVSELYEVRHVDSPCERPRLNLLIPTLSPQKAYGGITSAIAAFKALVAATPEPFDVRIISVTDGIGSAEHDYACEAFGRPLVRVGAPDDWTGVWTAVQVSDLQQTPLSLRRNDAFFATAWWTADLGLRLKEMQSERFGESPPLLYLIQDFEPAFYALTDRYFLAERTYTKSADMISLLNSEELYDYFLNRYPLESAWCLPFQINTKVEAGLREDLDRDVVLAYTRPGTPRNLYRILIAGLKQWRSRDPSSARFKLVFAGEAVPEEDLDGLGDVEAVGKMPIDAYATTLSRTAIGVSLMASPHPSYPPLEMALAGAITITNNFENKDLTARSPNFLTISDIAPETVRQALNSAARRLEAGETPSFGGPLGVPPGERRMVAWNDIAGELHERFRP